MSRGFKPERFKDSYRADLKRRVQEMLSGQVSSSTARLRPGPAPRSLFAYGFERDKCRKITDMPGSTVSHQHRKLLGALDALCGNVQPSRQEQCDNIVRIVG